MGAETIGYGFRTGPFPQDEVVEGYDIHITDSDYIRFGDLASTGDAYLGWDGSDLVLLPGADNTGSLVIGNGTLNFDNISVGAQASTAGSGMTMSATNAAGFAVFTDDGNAAISSATLTRAGRFRNLQVYTGANREQEAVGVIGQIVSVAGTNRHNMAGVMGSYEASTSLTVDGQAWSTDPWIQAGVIGRVGVGSAITTVNANGILAGLAAMSNTASFVAQNGIYTGLYVGSWSGAADFEYGIYIQGGAVSMAFQAGEQANTAGSGVTLNATYSSAFTVFSDDGNAAISSATLTRAGRFRNLQVYTAGNREQEACGLIGQLVSVAGTNRHNMAGLFGSYEAATSLTVDGQSAATDTWAQAAVIGRVGVGSAITTINANGVLAGFAAMSNTTSFTANNGVFAAFYAGGWSGSSTADWAYGVYLESGHVDVGIKMTSDIQGIDSVVSTLGATAIGHSFYVTVSAPNNQSGMSAYFDATINGTTAGHCYGVGSWINTGPTSPVLAASHIIVPFEGGVYTGEAQANARVVFGGQHQAILNGAPASLHCWRLNTTQTITALIAAANSGSVGYTVGSGSTGATLGYIPLAEIVGINSNNPVYVRVYAGTT